MNEIAPTRPKDTQPLAVEIERYLAAVDAFRRAGYAPEWRPEHACIAADDTQVLH
ncbi:MAG: hypothetical protein M3R70_01345 [Actinomycetota bacterium]|nr:hypothetical protein [Actinomycetota bacterium]